MGAAQEKRWPTDAMAAVELNSRSRPASMQGAQAHATQFSALVWKGAVVPESSWRGNTAPCSRTSAYARCKATMPGFRSAVNSVWQNTQVYSDAKGDASVTDGLKTAGTKTRFVAWSRLVFVGAVGGAVGGTVEGAVGGAERVGGWECKRDLSSRSSERRVLHS